MKKILWLAIFCLASLAFLAGAVWGAVMCVDPGGEGPYTDLQAALDTAAGNGEDDTIKVVMGTYTGNFTYDSNEEHNITLQGGYTAGCASRVVDPSLTILDGGGSDRVLYLENSSGGNVQVDGFTIQNGSSPSSSDEGGGVCARSESDSGTAGDITLTNNTITGNTSLGDAGGVYAVSYSYSGTAGAVTLTNNTLSGNTTGALSCGGGGIAESYSYSGTAGTVTLLNNTITGNSATLDEGGVNATSGSGYGTAGNVTITNNVVVDNDAVRNCGGVCAYAAVVITITNNTITGNSVGNRGGGVMFELHGSGDTINFYNNIIWGNTATQGPDDIDTSSCGCGTANGYNNDYHEMGCFWDNGGPTNIDADPHFVGGGDYHLQAGSQCIDKGLNSAPGIPSEDFEGDARIIDGNYDFTATVDMGADEYYVPVYVILHRDGALWSSATGWNMRIPPYYPNSAYARDLELLANRYLILHRDGAICDSVTGWLVTTPPYYPNSGYAVALKVTASGEEIVLHRDGALWSPVTGWRLDTPPYYPGSAYAKALEVREDGSFVILHKEGAVYDDSAKWVTTTPPYYPGNNWAVDMKIDKAGYVILHKDGAIWSTSGGWLLTTPPYYPNTAGDGYARALVLVGDGYKILHKDGAIYDSATGWVMTTPPYYPGSNYAVKLKVQ